MFTAQSLSATTAIIMHTASQQTECITVELLTSIALLFRPYDPLPCQDRAMKVQVFASVNKTVFDDHPSTEKLQLGKSPAG